jgi:hypothetical protein
MEYSWRCGTCGVEHDELPLSFGFDAASYWSWIPEADRESRGFCNEDICFMTDDDGNEARFVRGVIEIPILDAADAAASDLLIGVWTSLSEASFEQYLDLDRGSGEGSAAVGTWFGWLSNQIPAYPETLGLPTDVRPRDDDLRPLIMPHPGDHPLARDQAGITFARAVELAESWLHVLDE